MSRRAVALILLFALVASGCNGFGYRPPPGDQGQPIHGQTDGGSGGGSM